MPHNFLSVYFITTIFLRIMLIYSGLILVLHCSLTACCKVHRLQTFTLLVIYIGCLRAVTEFRIDHVTFLVVTYPVNNNALTSLFIARQALHLS